MWIVLKGIGLNRQDELVDSTIEQRISHLTIPYIICPLINIKIKEVDLRALR